jgi:type IV pilus assembly protein PilV
MTLSQKSSLILISRYTVCDPCKILLSDKNNMNTKPRTASKTCQSGSSLIEILISLFGIGITALAMMQINALSTNRGADQRNIAITQVNDMADRIRANPDGLRNGYYNNVSGTPSDPGCSTCTSQQIAQRDLYEWNTLNSSSLPNGQGRVLFQNNQYIIRLFWDSNRTGATGLSCSGNSSVDLTCYSVSFDP